MTQKYKTIITTEGRRKLAEALKPGGKKSPWQRCRWATATARKWSHQKGKNNW